MTCFYHGKRNLETAWLYMYVIISVSHRNRTSTEKWKSLNGNLTQRMMALMGVTINSQSQLNNSHKLANHITLLLLCMECCQTDLSHANACRLLFTMKPLKYLLYTCQVFRWRPYTRTHFPCSKAGMISFGTMLLGKEKLSIHMSKYFHINLSSFVTKIFRALKLDKTRYQSLLTR